jgi:hypothetical protein
MSGNNRKTGFIKDIIFIVLCLCVVIKSIFYTMDNLSLIMVLILGAVVSLDFKSSYFNSFGSPSDKSE